MRALLILLLTFAGAVLVRAQNQDTVETITVENAGRLFEIRAWPGFQQTSFSPDGSELVIVSNTGQIEFISLQTMEVVRMIEGIETQARRLTYSADGRELLLSNYIGAYTLVDVEAGEILAENVPVERFEFSPTLDVRKYVRGSYEEDVISIHDTVTGEELLWVEDAPHWSMNDDGTRLLTRSADEIIHVWDIETGEIIFEIMPPGDNVPRDGLHGAGFTPEGLVWATYPQYTEHDTGVSWDSPIRFWDISSGEIVLELEGNQYYRWLAFEPTHTYILAIGMHIQYYNEQCWIWAISTKEQLPCLAGGNESIRFSPDGRMLAINNGTVSNVYIRQTENPGSPLAILETDPTWYVEFSPDSKFLVTIDQHIHLWAVPSIDS